MRAENLTATISLSQIKWPEVSEKLTMDSIYSEVD